MYCPLPELHETKSRCESLGQRVSGPQGLKHLPLTFGYQRSPERVDLQQPRAAQWSDAETGNCR